MENLSKRLRQPDYTAADEAVYEARQAAQASRVYEPDTRTRDAQVDRIKAVEKADLRRQKRIAWRDRRIADLKQQVARRDHADTTTTTHWFGLGSKITAENLGRIRPYLKAIDTLERQQREDRGGPPSPALDRQYYASRETHTTWFGLGSKTTTTHLPGDASRPHHERIALEQQHNFRDGSRQGEWERSEQANADNRRTLGRLLRDDNAEQWRSSSTTQDVKARAGRVWQRTKEKAAALRHKGRGPTRKEPAKDQEPER